MIVRYWMTPSPHTATETMNLREAFALMRRYNVRRLPVVRDQDVSGIVTLSDMYRFIGPSDLAKSRVSSDADDVLKSHIVGEIMTPDPLTCRLNTPLEEVGDLMRVRKVGALPVIHEGRLAGIITESDVLRAFVSITRSGADGNRICFRIPDRDKIEVFSKLVALCEDFGVEIITLLTHPLQQESSLMVMMRFRGDRADEFMDALWKIHYQILTVE